MDNIVTRRPSRDRASTSRATAAPSADAASLYTRGGRRKYLNADERRRVLAGLDDLPSDQALFVLTLCWTGARISEVLALKPDAFQVDQGIVTFRTLKRRCHSMREVPVPPDLIEALDATFNIAAAQRGDGPSGKRLWPWHRVTAWRVVKRAMTEAGVTGTPASPRGLRHAFGVGTLQAGIPITLVQRWLGHSRITTTAIYAAVVGPEEIAFAQRFWGIGDDTGVPLSPAPACRPSV